MISTWKHVKLATKYVISRKSGTADYQKIADPEKDQVCSTTNECTYVNMGLVDGTRYHYKVIAVMAIGIDDNDLENAEVKSEDDDSALTSATPTTVEPEQVNIEHATKTNNAPLNVGAIITLTITPPVSPSGTVTGYKIKTLDFSETVIANSPVIYIGSSEQNPIQHDVTQAFGVARRYRVTAQSGVPDSITNARSDIPDSANEEDVAGILPAIPVASNFVASDVTDKVATLKWSKTGTATHYTLKRILNGTSTVLFTKKDVNTLGTTAI